LIQPVIVSANEAQSQAGVQLGKVHLRTGQESQEVEKRYSSTLNLSIRLGGGGSMPCPRHFTPGKETQYTLYMGWVGLTASLDEYGKFHPHWHFTPGKETQYTLYMGWVGLTASLDEYGKFCSHGNTMPRPSSR